MLRIAIVVIVLGTLWGCLDKPHGPTARPRNGEQMESFTGTLQSGVMAIGGETTGWRLVGDGESGGIEVDVANVRVQAETLAGRRVTVTGKLTHRDYVERGQVRVLVAERIRASAP